MPRFRSFNTRVKEDIEKRIAAVNQENIETNYESFGTQYEESFESLEYKSIILPLMKRRLRRNSAR